MKSRIILSFAALSAVLFLSFCRKNQQRPPLVTTSATIAGAREAQCSGVLYYEGDGSVTEKGICWGTSENISVEGNKVPCETEEQTFTADIKGLELETQYFAKAYAMNEFGVSYGEVVKFKTLGIDLPSLNLVIAYPAQVNHVQVTCYVDQFKPATYTTGVCWSTSSVPTVTNSSVVLGSRDRKDPVPNYKTYSLQIDSLEESTVYYARAFATSSLGTVYSNVINWTTPAAPNPVSFSMLSVGHTTASCNVSVTNINPSLVKFTGVCWSKNQFPTTANDKKEQPLFGSNPYTLSLLQVNTTYYVRAYIITDTKTIYGPQQLLIRTLKGTVTDINGNVYNTIQVGNQEWMTSNLRVSSFNNGTAITYASNNQQWTQNVNSYIPIFGYYGDSPANNTNYGKLYPRYVAQHVSLPPVGWHVATVSDWQNLLAITGVPALCVNNGAWGQSQEITNSYGFSLFPAGYLDYYHTGGGYQSRLWAGTSTSSINGVQFNSYSSYTFGFYANGTGCSIRCVKN